MMQLKKILKKREENDADAKNKRLERDVTGRKCDDYLAAGKRELRLVKDVVFIILKGTH